MTEPSKEDLERAFKIVNRVMNKPYNDAKNLKADIAQALAEVRAEGERERKELTRLQRANELFAETHEDLVEQQLEFKSEQDTLTQAIAERDKKIADYHNALEGKKQKIYLLEQRLASLAEKTVDRIYIYEGSDQEAEICNELYREKLVLEQRIRELEGQKTCQHNNITTQVHHSSKISSFCDDCKVRLYPETEAIDELQREITRLKAENAELKKERRVSL